MLREQHVPVLRNYIGINTTSYFKISILIFSLAPSHRYLLIIFCSVYFTKLFYVFMKI